MGRSKQYDRTELLDRAVELFRRQGFNGTSTAELVAELGVNRKSMYAEFGSKQELFEATLEHYNAKHLTSVLAPLEAPDADATEGSDVKKPGGDSPMKKPGDIKKSQGEPKADKSKDAGKRPQSGADIIKMGDKNGDGFLTKDEFDEKTRPFFEATDTDSNGKVDAREIEAGMRRMKEAAKARRTP